MKIIFLQITIEETLIKIRIIVIMTHHQKGIAKKGAHYNEIDLVKDMKKKISIKASVGTKILARKIKEEKDPIAGTELLA